MPAIAKAPTRRPFRAIDIWRRYLPPVRLVWIFLLGLVASQGSFANGAEATIVLSTLFLGVVTDLGFQRVKFPKLRMPDAALATSLFLVVIIWPATVTMALVSVVVVAIGFRHVVRVGSHPLLNPAGAGVVLGTVLFGLSTSWHVGLTPAFSLAIAAVGALLVVRAPHTYRLPVGYFGVFLPATVALTFALGGGRHWLTLLETGALAPGSVFFGMFMVTEPRTAPSARWAMWAFAGLVGFVSAVLPVAFTEVPTLGALGVLAPFFALFAGNLFTVVLPTARGRRQAIPTSPPTSPTAQLGT